MKVLCIIPPYVPSYFNAGHHLHIFQTAEYLRIRRGDDVIAKDFGASNATWRDVCNLLVRDYDVIAMLDDFDSVDGFERFVTYAREISPAAKLITFGRGSRQVPGFFKRFAVDAIVCSGDFEAGVSAYLDHLSGDDAPPGVMLRNTGYAEPAKGLLLAAHDWVLPNIDDIPYDAYDRLYADDLNKFCGIPQRRELVVPVARGCPIGCSFCDVPSQQGLKERRLPTEDVVQYIEDSYSKKHFDYVSFYAPTFTLKRRWVDELCKKLIARMPSVRWKCVTALGYLDHELLEVMARSGCIRISVGIETLHPTAGLSLPKVKRHAEQVLEQVTKSCDQFGIELNCFIMVGMPGEPIKDSAEVIGELLSRGFRVRPTIYTPYEKMKPDMRISDYSRFNRQLLLGEEWDVEDRAAAYALLYADLRDRSTTVMDKIPRRRQTT